MKVKQLAHNQCAAYISVQKNKMKEYGQNTYYLNDKQEFELVLVNNTQDVVMAKISMNDKNISNNYGLVLKPGQRVTLERYLDEASKFKFETYTIDNTPQGLKAIEKNGNIKVEFFKEKEKIHYMPAYTYNSSLTNDSWNCFMNVSNTCYSGSTTIGSSPQFNSGQQVNSSKSLRRSAEKASLETGRIEKGSSSNQKFKDYQGEFNSYPFQTIEIKLMPFSHKPLSVNDLATYCTNCGTKNKKGNYRYCPKCGTKF